MKKKVLAAALVLAALTGCGGNSSKTEGPVEIEYWFGLGGNLGDNMVSIIDDFNNSQEEYVVKPAIQGDYSETYQRLQAAMAARTAPEIAVLSSETAFVMGQRGLTETLNPLIDADEEFRMDDYIGAFREQVKIDGDVYALPAYGTSQVLYYNKEVLEESGYTEEDMRTWQGLAQIAESVTESNGDNVTYYGWQPMWGMYNMVDAALSNGAQFISEDGTTVLIDSDEWVEVWDQFRSWIHEDNIMRVHSGGQGWEYWYRTIDDVMQDRAFGYTGSAGDQGDLDFEKLAATTQPGWEDHPAKPQAGAQAIFIPKGTSGAKKEGAFEFMKYFTSPEVTARWSMNTGYIAVRQSVTEIDFYSQYIEENPQALVPLVQANTGSPDFFDPTNGRILDAMRIAADRVQIENVDAAVALREAAETAQRELDRVLEG